MKEEIQELALSTLVTQLEVLYELHVDFENLKVSGFDLTEGIKTQGWEGYFHHFKGPVYTESVKQFWTFATTISLQITSFVLGHKIYIFEKLIAKLLNHDGF